MDVPRCLSVVEDRSLLPGIDNMGKEQRSLPGNVSWKGNLLLKYHEIRPKGNDMGVCSLEKSIEVYTVFVIFLLFKNNNENSRMGISPARVSLCPMHAY